MLTRTMLGGEKETTCANCGHVAGSGREPTAEERLGYAEPTDHAGKLRQRHRKPSIGRGALRVKL